MCAFETTLNVHVHRNNVILKPHIKPSQTRLWSRPNPNCYGRRKKKQSNNLVKIGAYRTPLGPLSTPKKESCC